MSQPRERGSRSTVVVDLKVDESLTLDLNEGDEISLLPGVDIKKIHLTLRAKHGQRARVVVQADRSVKVRRPEKAQA